MLALAVPTSFEQSHMGHPDFRVAGKIFASIGVPDEDWAMVKLAPDQQRAFISKERPLKEKMKNARRPTIDPQSSSS